MQLFSSPQGYGFFCVLRKKIRDYLGALNGDRYVIDLDHEHASAALLSRGAPSDKIICARCCTEVVEVRLLI